MRQVTKCICHKNSFAMLKEYAEKHDINSVEILQENNMCSRGCRMCKPYVEVMLKTGQTEFQPGEPYRRSSNPG